MALMNKADILTKQQISNILESGTWDENPRPRYKDGTPAYTKFITNVVEEYDLSKGEFPITQLRPIPWENGIKEGFWIYQDQTSNLGILEDKHGIHWWNSWQVDEKGIGQRYGATVKRYDLINKLIHNLKTDPFSRRHILNLWQENDFQETDGLLPCAFMSMYSVRKVNGELYLDSSLIQRSSDYLVAGHINKMQYVSLQMQLAHECGMKVGKFTHYVQNLHIYDKHIDNAKIMLEREPEQTDIQLNLNAEGKGFYDITIDDFELINYNPIRPQLKFELGI